MYLGNSAAKPPRKALAGSAKDLLKRDTILHADLPGGDSFLRGLGRSRSDTAPILS